MTRVFLAKPRVFGNEGDVPPIYGGYVVFLCQVKVVIWACWLHSWVLAGWVALLHSRACMPHMEPTLINHTYVFVGMFRHKIEHNNKHVLS
jgi:hypothetical protein